MSQVTILHNAGEPYDYQGFVLSANTCDQLLGYIERGIIPGGYLQSLLTNDLRGAVLFADPESLANIKAAVGFLNWKAPAACWGSKKAVDKWIKAKAEEKAIAKTTRALTAPAEHRAPA